LIYLNLAYLAVVYARNPVGVWAMQSCMVGGRPYFEIGLALCGFMILSRVQISNGIATAFPMFFVVPSWLIGISDVIGRIVPEVGYALSSIYSGVGSRGVSGALQEEAQLGETRMTGLQFAGMSSVLALCAKYNPITLISPLFPGRVALFVVALAAIFLSGFRSMLLYAMAVFLLATLLRGRLRDLWIAGSVMLVAIMALVLMQGSVLQLPRTM